MFFLFYFNPCRYRAFDSTFLYTADALLVFVCTPGGWSTKHNTRAYVDAVFFLRSSLPAHVFGLGTSG